MPCFSPHLAVVASSIERLATEIRHLQRTEVLEVEEYFSPGQKGSSAMPHKRNPVLTENLTGLARLVRSAVVPALENVALWHERDISHSSVERGIGPDATIHLDFALKRLTGVIDKLLVYPENMQRNLDRLGGLIHSQRVLLALTQKGMSREESYAAVQSNAMPVWRGEGNFLELLKEDKEVSTLLSAAELEACSTLVITPSMSTRFSGGCSGSRQSAAIAPAEWSSQQREISMRSAVIAAALVLTAAPALAAGQTIQVNASFNSQVIVTDDNESKILEQEKTLKRAMYERAARECDDMRATIALTCSITNISVSTSINRNYGQPPSVYVNSSVTLQVTLKQ